MTKDAAHDPSFEYLLEYIRDARGFDFTGYKRSSLMRRVDKRMQTLSLTTYDEYRDYLEVHPDEFNLLFNTILINVTSFFRDIESWRHLETEIIPELLKRVDGDIRIWSAGCASGQEVYSLAMLFCDALGESDFRERVKLYATDIDEEALSHARQACYDERALESLPKPYLEKYFVRTGANYTFRPELRRSIIFGRHDLVQDAPISKLDLLVCRNSLMYLNAETQARILARLHFALKPTGFLFLGRAEMLLSHTSLFEPVHLPNRIFSKVSKLNLRERLLVMGQIVDNESSNQLMEYIRLRELSFNNSFVAHVVIDNGGNLELANLKAREMFQIRDTDIGSSFADSELSYRPLELRSLIEQSIQDLRTVKVMKIARGVEAGVQYLDVQISPLRTGGGELIGTSIIFADVTDFHILYQKLHATHEELETTNEELESTNEELETTNEELQSANEELETTNEELQSANEELETTNAELQSTNEELESTNADLRRLASEAEVSNQFLESVFTSLRHGLIVIDNRCNVLVWNPQCVELWGLREEEAVGKNLYDLDLGLPLNELKAYLNSSTFQTPSSVVLGSVNRRGRHIECLVRITQLTSKNQVGGLVLLLDETAAKQGAG